MPRCLCTLAVLLVGGSSLASAQVSSVTGPVAPIPAALHQQAVDAMTRDLQSLVVAMELYFSAQGTYSGELSKRERSRIFVEPRPGVTLSLTYATRTSWTARATHDWLPASSCVISIGELPASRIPKTSATGLVPRSEGVPVCDPQLPNPPAR